MAVEFEFISCEEAWKIFDECAQRDLGISGEEFARRWDAGYYTETALEDTVVMRVAMLQPRFRGDDE